MYPTLAHFHVTRRRSDHSNNNRVNVDSSLFRDIILFMNSAQINIMQYSGEVITAIYNNFIINLSAT